MKITYSWRIIQQVLSSYMYTMRAGNGLSYRLRVVGSIPLCYGLATCVGKLAVYVCVCWDVGDFICLYLVFVCPLHNIQELYIDKPLQEVPR